MPQKYVEITEHEWYMFDWIDVTTFDQLNIRKFVKGQAKHDWPVNMKDGDQPHMVQNCLGFLVPAMQEME